MTSEERNAIVAAKVNTLRKELESLGMASSFFYRTPGAAKDPVAYLLIGERPGDVEEARGNKIF